MPPHGTLVCSGTPVGNHCVRDIHIYSLLLLKIQSKLFNVITLGRTTLFRDHINRVIPVTGNIYLLLSDILN